MCRKVSEVIDENLKNVTTSFETGENLRTMCKEAMAENRLGLDEEKMKKWKLMGWTPAYPNFMKNGSRDKKKKEKYSDVKIKKKIHL